MVDPGFVPGLIGVGIQITIGEILRHINIAVNCRKELTALKDTLMRIEPFIKEIRLALNKHKDEAPTVDNWFEELDALLKHASEIVQLCIPRWGIVSRYQTCRKITDLTQKIDKLLTRSDLVLMVQLVQVQKLTRKILEGQCQIIENIETLASSSSSASTSQAVHAPIGTINSKKEDKTVTVTASRPSNLSKVSSFQDEQLDSHGFVSHDVEEEEDPTENQRFGKALDDFPADCDDELNLTAGEDVEILGEQDKWLYVRKKQPGTDSKVAGWVPMSFVKSHSSFPLATTRYLQEDKRVTGTASGLSNLSKFSPFQDQHLDFHGLVSHDVEEEVLGENQRFGKALYDFPAGSEDELNLTAGEEVEILGQQTEWFYVSKKQPGRDGKEAGWVPVFYLSPSYSSF